MSQTMLALLQPEIDTRPYGALRDVARSIHQHLLRQGTISRQALQKLMMQCFGASDASGAWSMRDAYEALEAAQVLLLRDPACPLLSGPTPSDQFRALHSFERSLPTQTYRSERQIDLQQFSTPLTLAWFNALAACIGPADLVLEPSAGTGMLAVHARRAGARLLLNERDAQRAALVEEVLATAVTRHDAEHIDELLAHSVRPTVVLINPPFSRSAARGADRHAGARHLRSALLRLAPGGRCVAIMSPGFARGNTGGPGYEVVCEVAVPRVEIDIEGSPYSKHGTSIDVRLVVFDKGWSGVTERHRAPDLAAALPLLLKVPPRLPLDEPPAPQAARAVPRLPTRTAPQGLLRGLTAKPLAAPVLVPQPVSPIAPLAYRVRDEIRPAGDASGIYAPWRLARIDIDGANPHPDALVESLAMASVPPPAPRYRPMLPDRTVRALSDAQLEVIIQAGDAFARDLPGRFRANDAGDRLIEDETGAAYRTGFYIGDGTGVGKGREAAGCIMDQWCQGRRKAVYLSKSTALEVEAKRDWTALGGLSVDIQGLDVFPLGTPITMPAGILFCTYATLRSQRHDEASRLQQILDWLGNDFDGIIVIDEAHALANAAGTETQFGAAKGSEQGLAGVRLQNALPRARILYLSATGATDPANLCYAARLGLWGPGTAFPDRNAFMAAMDEGGIAAMEIVARDLKAMGLYTARALSFAGVEYEALEHQLTVDQIDIYDAFADSWSIIHRNLDEVLKASGIVDRMSGDVLNAQARSSALSRFESSKQRFFSALLVALKMPTLIKAIEAELGHGHAAVVQLVTTAEAILDRRLAGLSDEERASLDLELSPLDTLIEYLRSGFPTRQMRTFRTDGGDLRSELMVDEHGNAVHCQEAIRARDNLIEQLCSMPAIPAALDSLLRHFGADAVAEVTGRSRRIIVDRTGRQKLERRGARASIADADAFQDGRKALLVFSDAGGTGRSYHAERNAKSAGKRRIHFLLEPGWRAAAAVQGLGRTHRTNQTVPPVFRPVTTDCKGERRFISTIARRLDSLGALTRGQRQTGGQNLFDPADNLESDYAREALNQWYHLLHDGKLASTTLDGFTDLTGLKLTNADDGSLLEHLPPIQRWLNRILALRIATQNAIFEEYLGLIQARVDAAREAGTLDVGVETIFAEKVIRLDDQLLRRDPVTGAETRLQRLELHIKRHATSFHRLMTVWGETPDIGYLWNSRSGRVALRVPSWSVTDEEGRIIPMCRMVRPTGSDRLDAASLWHSHWTSIEPADFQSRWDEETVEAQSKVDVETISIATGLLLPVWHKLPTDDVRVWRVSDEAGNSLLGRIVPDHAIGALASAFGIDAELRLTPQQILAAARDGAGASLPGFGDARLVTALVNGQRRLEIKDFPPERREWLKSLGCFVEIIAYKARMFVPVDRAAAIIDRVLPQTP
ncbi:strawberry notch family protein [Sphingomonas oligophenolica]|uniref:Strawberry notch family protein n=1 Tax=Sphingomonas oligophenolica TaxID=301154 RepID=A0ABU9Y366_9SPHN